MNIRPLLALAGLVSTAPALAWDGQITRQIRGVDIADGPNYAFRIDLHGAPQMCGSSATWAYVDSTARTTAGDAVVVVVYTNRDAGTGYCRIGYVRTIVG